LELLFEHLKHMIEHLRELGFALSYQFTALLNVLPYRWKDKLGIN